MSSKLPNYLKRHRKLSALSQDEIAFLLGARSGSKASRYERFVRKPSLSTALGFEVIFGISVRELFSGAYEKVERDISMRAKVLQHRTNIAKRDGSTSRKLKALEAIIMSQSKQ